MPVTASQGGQHLEVREILDGADRQPPPHSTHACASKGDGAVATDANADAQLGREPPAPEDGVSGKRLDQTGRRKDIEQRLRRLPNGLAIRSSEVARLSLWLAIPRSDRELVEESKTGGDEGPSRRAPSTKPPPARGGGQSGRAR